MEIAETTAIPAVRRAVFSIRLIDSLFSLPRRPHYGNVQNQTRIRPDQMQQRRISTKTNNRHQSSAPDGHRGNATARATFPREIRVVRYKAADVYGD